MLWLFAGIGAAILASSAGQADSGFSLKEHGYYLINFIVFAWIMYYLSAPKIKEWLKQRSEDMKTKLQTAQRLKNEAEKQLREAERKIQNLEREKKELIARFDKELEKIKADAQRRLEESSKRIQIAFEESIRSERKRITRQLRAELASIAIDKAQQMLEQEQVRVCQDRLVKDFIEGIEQTKRTLS